MKIPKWGLSLLWLTKVYQYKESLDYALLSVPFLFSAPDVRLYNPNKLKVIFTEKME